MSSDKIAQVCDGLNMLHEDNSIPRNIRRAALNSLEIIREPDSELSLAVKANNAIEILDEISQDPNCPAHARTMLLQIITLLEITDFDY